MVQLAEVVSPVWTQAHHITTHHTLAYSAHTHTHTHTHHHELVELDFPAQMPPGPVCSPASPQQPQSGHSQSDPSAAVMNQCTNQGHRGQGSKFKVQTSPLPVWLHCPSLNSAHQKQTCTVPSMYRWSHCTVCTFVAAI